MSKVTGRELFEKVYADEMAVDPTLVFGLPQEIDFEDATMREAAYAGWILAMSFAHEQLFEAKQAMDRLRAAVIGPVSRAKSDIVDISDKLSNFPYQLNRHETRKETPANIDPLTICHQEAVIECSIENRDSVTAPFFLESSIPKYKFHATEDYQIGVALDFDKFYPVGHRQGTLFMANSVGPANKGYQQNVFIVLEIKGDPDLYALSWAESVAAAHRTLQEFGERCVNICPVGEIRSLGGNLNGGPITALVLPLCINHHVFQRAQQ